MHLTYLRDKDLPYPRSKDKRFKFGGILVLFAGNPERNSS